MKLALISLDKSGGTPPLGLAYIASYLREYGSFNDIIIVDKEDPIKRIKKEKPDVVGVSAVTEEFGRAMEVSSRIKEVFDVPVLIGGVHISLLPHTLPKAFDIGIIGEGEKTMLELVQLFEKYGGFPIEKINSIDGLAYHNGSAIKITKERSQIEPLDSIPYPARDLLKMKEYYLQPRRLPGFSEKVSIGTHIITTRGCPYKCSFCSSSAFWKKLRLHSAEYVVGEIKEVIEKYKVDVISLYDDLFIASKKRLQEVVELIKNEGINEKVEFATWGRANLINDDVCRLLKQMNVRAVSFGFESNSERVLKYLKGESVTPADNERAVQICRKYGLTVSGSFIIGNPHEKKEDIEKTFDFIKKYVEHDVKVYTMVPLPGTIVWEEAKKQGIVSENTDSWNDFDVSIKEEQKIYFTPEDMTEEEFKNKLTEIRNFITENEKKRKIDVKMKYFFNKSIVKKMLMHPKWAVYYLKRIIRK